MYVNGARKGLSDVFSRLISWKKAYWFGVLFNQLKGKIKHYFKRVVRVNNVSMGR